MFQAARPLLMWSIEANCRARLKGSVYVVEAVAMSPTRLVDTANAASTVIGSSQVRGAWATSPPSAS